MDFHPVSEIFPLMDAEDIGKLAADIKENGLREKIWTFGGKIIDGRNRFKACEIAGVPAKSREYDGDASGLVKFVLSLNLHRRHLSSSQRSMVADKAATLEPGEKLDGDSNVANATLSQSDAAEMLGVSRDSVIRARKVREHADPAVAKAVEQGKVKVSDAAKVANLPKETQRAALRAVTSGKAPTLAKAAESHKPKEPEYDVPEAELVKDSLKGTVPAELCDVFTQVAEFRKLMAAISECKTEAKNLTEHPSGGWLDLQEIERLLTDARAAVRFAMPYTECPKCRRKPTTKCPTCKGTGWITESLYKTSASDDDKAWLENRS